VTTYKTFKLFEGVFFTIDTAKEVSPEKYDREYNLTDDEYYSITHGGGISINEEINELIIEHISKPQNEPEVIIEE